MKQSLTICLWCFILTFLARFSWGEPSAWSPTLTKDGLIAKAQGGDPYFQAILGIYLRAGEMGMQTDFTAARKWSEKAADAGSPLGLYNLANLALLEGNFKESNSYYQDAQLRLARKASGGDPIAQFAMGEICFFVAPRDHQRAIAYFKESAAGGYPQGQATLGALYLKGIPHLLPKDLRKGIALLVQGAHQQSMTSRLNLGMAYYNGEGVEKDNDLAIRWLRLASDQNFAEAQHWLATLLLEVDPVGNKHEGIRLLRLAASQNHAEAAQDLQDLSSISDKQNDPDRPSSAIAHQKRSNDDERKKAVYYRSEGQRHYNGQGVLQSYEKAHACFKTAAELGDPESQRYLALLYFHGKGCIKDRSKAGYWLRTAASKGDDESKRILTTFARFFKE